MPSYIALIDQEDGAFGAILPDCPGCTAMGSGIDDAVASLTGALQEWMADRVDDGLAPPPARSITALRTEEPQAFRPNTVVAMIPLMPDTGRMVRSAISLGGDQPSHVPRSIVKCAKPDIADLLSMDKGAELDFDPPPLHGAVLRPADLD